MIKDAQVDVEMQVYKGTECERGPHGRSCDISDPVNHCLGFHTKQSGTPIVNLQQHVRKEFSECFPYLVSLGRVEPFH